ncbi:hypothetical protein [Streptococcus suis]|uniref:hypothetical protein n=1 Tax=Streptococcus suis TaxID=1307 RepID=UPI001EE7148A|nr:hypothetical protein [Streptococcus suis]
MIEIFPCSITSYLTSFIIHLFLIARKQWFAVKTKLGYEPYNSWKPTTYFIVKSRALSSEKMHFFLRDIRQRSELANIIIIGKDIDYEELFRNHYRVFGVIDTSEDQSFGYIRKEIFHYLDALYPSQSPRKKR